MVAILPLFGKRDSFDLEKKVIVLSGSEQGQLTELRDREPHASNPFRRQIFLCC